MIEAVVCGNNMTEAERVCVSDVTDLSCGTISKNREVTSKKQKPKTIHFAKGKHGFDRAGSEKSDRDRKTRSEKQTVFGGFRKKDPVPKTKTQNQPKTKNFRLPKGL